MQREPFFTLLVALSIRGTHVHRTCLSQLAATRADGVRKFLRG